MTDRDEDFDALLEESSLGAAGARELRRRTSPGQAQAARALAGAPNFAVSADEAVADVQADTYAGAEAVTSGTRLSAVLSRSGTGTDGAGVSADGSSPGRGQVATDALGPLADGGSPGPGRAVRRLSLDGESYVGPLARDFTRQVLYAWGWLPAVTADQRAFAEDVLLVVSELVTNACLHADGPDELRISGDRKVIRLEVSDRGAGQPAPRIPHRAGRPGGHGMFIVHRLCLDWGVVRTAGVAGKTVWAELGAPLQ